MSSFQHPEDGVLLRYIDGELPGRKARQIRHHLEACWQCRGAVEELQSTVAECVRYRKQLPNLMPAPPRPWAELDFAAIDAELSAEPFWKRYFTFPVMRQALAGAAVLALLAAVIYQFQKAPAVQAAALLHRAIAAEAARPHAAHALRIHSGSFDFTRAATRAAGTVALPAAAEALFAAAHYNSEDPLSAQSYLAWHDSLPQKEDDAVTTVADPLSRAESCYRVHTVARSGDVTSATLLLATGDLHAVQGRLEFRDNNFIEFTELSDLPDRGQNPAVAHVEDPVRPGVPSRPAAEMPGASASISDQVEVLSVLHQIGADLGEPVEVSLSGGKVVVAGVGVAPQIQQRIHQELDARANVTVQFSEPQAVNGRVVPGQPVAGSSGAVQSRLEDQLGSRANFLRFSAQVVKSNEDAMARAFALRNLAQKFPVDVEAGLSSSDRRMLRDMLRDHLSQLSKQAVDVQSLLVPSLKSIGATVQARRPVDGATWQSSVEEVLRAAQLVEVRLSVLLGLTPGQNSTSTQFPSEVLTSMEELRAQLDHCTALLAQ